MANLKEFKTYPILGLKNDVPPHHSDMIKQVGKTEFQTHDAGGLNLDYTRKRRAVTKSLGYDAWSGSAVGTPSISHLLDELYDGCYRSHILFETGRMFHFTDLAWNPTNECTDNIDASITFYIPFVSGTVTSIPITGGEPPYYACLSGCATGYWFGYGDCTSCDTCISIALEQGKYLPVVMCASDAEGYITVEDQQGNIISGHFAAYTPMTFDDANTSDTIAKNGNIEVYVLNGIGPFRFETRTLGYDFEGGQTYTTTARNATLNCDDGTCLTDFYAYCDIKIIDTHDDTEVTACILNTSFDTCGVYDTEGSWQQLVGSTMVTFDWDIIDVYNSATEAETAMTAWCAGGCTTYGLCTSCAESTLETGGPVTRYKESMWDCYRGYKTIDAEHRQLNMYLFMHENLCT